MVSVEMAAANGSDAALVLRNARRFGMPSIMARFHVEKQGKKGEQEITMDAMMVRAKTAILARTQTAQQFKINEVCP